MGGTQSQQPEVPQGRIEQNPEKIEKLATLLSLKSGHQRAVTSITAVDSHEQDKHNVQLLKSLFRRLDPAVMKSVEVSGEVQLSFKYDFKREFLLVKVIRCRDLLRRTVRTRACDPFVKLQMNPDNHGQGTKMTKIIVESNAPRFNEIFAFTMRELELLEARLVVQLWNYDVASSDDFLGEVIIPMSSFSFKDDPIHTAWYSLKMQTDLSVSGELEVSMAYQVPDRLLVSVHGASGLSPKDDSSTANPFVKLSIPGSATVYRTKTKKDTLEPVWEETFEFDIPLEELSFRYIVFHLIDEGYEYENVSHGQVIVDLDELDPEEGFHASLKLADLRNSERLRGRLSQHAVAQEFREAFLAHCSAQLPSFLFHQQHSGKKMVTVSCRKAGSRAKMRLVDGIPVP